MSKVNYLEKEELLEEFRKSKKNKEKYPNAGPDKWITRKLTRLYMRMVDHIAAGKYAGNGSNYLMEMKSQAYLEFSRYALSFPDEPPYNLFSYYTTMIHSAFKRALKREKTQEKITGALKDQVELTLMTGYSTTEFSTDIEDENEDN